MLYRAQNNNLANLAIPRLQTGGHWEWTSTASVSFVTDQETYIRMTNTNGDTGVMVLGAGITMPINVNVVGAGGINDVVGGGRCYSGRIIGSDDGVVVSVYGVRQGAAVVLPAGFDWMSDAMVPIIIEQGGNVLDIFDHRDGWFDVGVGQIEVATALAVAANTVIDLTNTPAAGDEVADILMQAMKFTVLLDNAAGVQTLTLLERDLTGGVWRAGRPFLVGNVAPNAWTAQHVWEVRMNKVNGPADSIGYAWDGAPAGGGLDLFLKMVKY